MKKETWEAFIVENNAENTNINITPGVITIMSCTVAGVRNAFIFNDNDLDAPKPEIKRKTIKKTVK